MANEKTFEIKVFGQTFSVKSDADEEHIKAVANYVNEKMEEILKKTRSVSTLNVAILTALNIADDLLKERQERIAIIKEIETKSKDLAEKIEKKIEEKGNKNLIF